MKIIVSEIIAFSYVLVFSVYVDWLRLLSSPDNASLVLAGHHKGWGHIDLCVCVWVEVNCEVCEDV